MTYRDKDGRYVYVPAGCLTPQEFEMRAQELRENLMSHYNGEWRKALISGVILGCTFVASLWIIWSFA